MTAGFTAPSTGAAPAAVLEDVTVVTKGRRILGPISLRIGRGEHWAMLGPNGAGKTTLLTILGAARHPTSGRAEVLGAQLGRSDLRSLRAEIGSVGHRVADAIPPVATSLEVVLTGPDGLLAPWWSSFGDKARGEAAAMLERVGCAHLADQAFGLCSQGERQRVLLARSLMGRHRLLLLDEPAVGVDLPGREALVAVLDDLARDPEGPATLHVVHTLEELPSSTSHALLISGGTAVASGSVDDVLTSSLLSACFGHRFEVERRGGRFSAWAAGSF